MLGYLDHTTGHQTLVASADAKSLIAQLHDSHGLVRQRAREALVKLGAQAVPTLLAALAENDDNVRYEVVKALSEIADPRSVDALVPLLEDKHFGVRWLAAEALANIGRPAVAPLLRALIDRPDSIWLQRGAHHVLVCTAGNSLDELIMPVLMALEDIEPSVTAPLAASDALVGLGEWVAAPEKQAQERAA